MPRTVTTGLYDFDPLMKNPSNRVVNEKQVLVVPGRDDFHFLIPQAAPFFVTSMVVRNETTNETYVEGVDYVFGHWFVEAMERTGRSTAGSIRFLRRNIAGIIVLDYHTLGGQWGFDDQAVLRELSQRTLNPLVRSWAQIDVLPALFPPVPHDQVVDNLVGWEEVVESVGGIADAIAAANEGSDVKHINDRNNPHVVTKAQVGLGNVDNYLTVTDVEARATSRADRFMTPRGTRLAFESQVMPTIQNHLDDVDNPHKTTKIQVGLGNVENYPVATKSEAEDLLLPNRYITPERLGEALQHWYDENLASYFGGGGDNPTGVTKAQVGLGNVENYRIATDTEAVQGTRNDLYMTPLRTYQLVDAFALIPLGQHIANELNPHNVTKAQVGLGSVLNYGTASEDEAKQGIRNDRYMTPLRTQQLIETLVTVSFDQHLLDQSNPHNVTKAQVGLGSVLNYGLASEEEAIQGIRNDRYMTPYLTQQLVETLGTAPINQHRNDTNNPHEVTKAQVGLGAVSNFGLASEADAKQGSRNDLYMTPLRTQQLMETVGLAPLDQHKNDTNNPHGVTKSQVGLGNVENYRIATQLEAQNGSSNSTYMTPLRTNEAVREVITNELSDIADEFSQVNGALANKLDVSGTATDSSLVYGKTESELLETVRSQTVANAVKFDGNTYTEMLAETKAQTSYDSDRLGGLTIYEVQENIQQGVMDNADLFSSVNYTLLDISYFSTNSIAPILSFDTSSNVNGVLYIETNEGLTTVFVNTSTSVASYLNILSGLPPEIILHRVVDSTTEMWYVERNTTIITLGFLDLGNSGVYTLGAEDHNSGGPYTIPGTAEALVFNDVRTSDTLRLDELEQAFQDAADELAA